MMQSGNINPAAVRKLKGALGLAMKAGFVRDGEFASEQLIKAGRARLCVLADDCSDATGKHFKDMCAFRRLPAVTAGFGKDELGRIIGRQSRAVIVITDEGFADNVIRIIKGGYADGQ